MENKNLVANSEVIIKEVSLDEIEALEETVTPGGGLICGSSCAGLICF